MKRFAVFSIRKTRDGQTLWVRAGNAVENRDKTIQVHLDVLPLEGQLTLRDENADCTWCQRLGVGTPTAESAHRAGHPERSRAEGGD